MKNLLLLFLLLVTLCNQFAAGDEPQVLIIGDSISMGYTPYVIAMLEGEAHVVHHRGNAEHTGTGLKKIDEWLGDTEWDVIHFNWGLWDLCYRHPDSLVQGRRDKLRGVLTTSLEDYERNLEQLVTRLRQTKATLIWATTTVVPENEAGRMVGDDLKYNQVAARVMHKHGVAINDLNKLTRSFAPEVFKQAGDVHFTVEGYMQLAGPVADSIRTVLSNTSELAKPIGHVAFGSCIKQDLPMPLLSTIAEQAPELMIFLGDNIYGDTEDMDVMKSKYERLASDVGFTRLRATCPTLATWDDHDFGVNDGGADYPRRVESERIFEDFWYGDTRVPARTRPGIYAAYFFGPPNKRLQVILLDTRFFRSPLRRGGKRIGGSWVSDDDPKKTMLGDAQWKWLETQLHQQAEVRIIASSIQFLAEGAGQETWSNLPRERQRMLDLLKSTEANGVVFISGDRHWAELSSLEEGLPDRLYDLTSSSFNQDHERGTPTENRHRHLSDTYHQANYGEIHIDWDSPAPSVRLEIHGLGGDVPLKHRLSWTDKTRK